MTQTFNKLILAMAIAAASAVCANAQPQGGFPGGGPGGPGGPWPGFNGEAKPMPSVNEMAQRRANEMDHVLTLTEKQYNKILKFYKAQIQKEQEMIVIPEGGFPEGGFPGGGMPMGGGFPGGGMPMGGGGFGGGMPMGGMPMGGPGMGGGFPGGGSFGTMMTEEEVEKYYEKQDKKLQKILTPEQYTKWRQIHPTDRPQLPKFGDFDPSKMPEGFDPSKMPEGFDWSKMPQRKPEQQ